jgi:site-specific DNA-methyltransferase (cytosine-N4-specific)
MTMNATQIELFEHVTDAFSRPHDGRLTNRDVYPITAGRAGISKAALEAPRAFGKAGAMRSEVKHRIRWILNTLKTSGIIQHVDGERGVWELTEAGRSRLRKIRPDVSCLGYSTDLGIAIWSDAKRVLDHWQETIFLALTSPPYPLRIPRLYGGPPAHEHVDFLCRHFEPIVKHLAPGGNIVLNLGDVFEDRSPAKSTYIEEVTLAFKERFGLHLMNRIIWQSNKPPSPAYWASVNRMQVNEGYELCLWFTNDPVNCIADNRRILEPHTERHKDFVAKGGVKVARSNGDGAHRQRVGAYATQTEGRIPRNIWQIGNRCDSQRAYKERARELGLLAHGATFPLELARKFILFMTEVGQLVVDPFFGSNTTGLAADQEGRPWVATDLCYDYVRGSAERFRDAPGFELALP